MDAAIEHFKVLLQTAIHTETRQFESEISALKERVHKLNEELVEKDRQCRHLINLLHSKNAEWKRIKTKMMQRRSVVEDTRPSGNTSGGYNEDTNTNGASEDNGSSADSSDDCTQLPANKLLNVDTETNPGSSQTSNYSNSIPVAAALAETQSNLDALICLISETESEPGTTENTLQVTCTAQNKLASATFNKVPSPSFKRNRKSHAGGCACCDKYYSATRSSEHGSSHDIVAADSFFAAPKTPPGFWDTSFTPRQ